MAPVASPRVLEKPVLLVQERAGESSALRLLSAERSEEIFPILLEEVVKLGFPRALVLEVDFDDGVVRPATRGPPCHRRVLPNTLKDLLRGCRGHRGSVRTSAFND